MDWFKTKKQNSPVAASPDNLLSLVHTMEDDLSGADTSKRTASTPTSAPAPEPLVSFQPGASKGTPFFAAPGVVPSPEEVSEPSPFLSALSETPVTSPESVAPEGSTPPAGLPVVEPAFKAEIKMARPVEVAPELSFSAPPVAESPISQPTPLPPENIPVFEPTPTAFSPETAVSPAETENFSGQSVSQDEVERVPFNTNTVSSMVSWRERMSDLPRTLRRLQSRLRERRLIIVGALAGLLLLLAIGSGLYFWWQGRSIDPVTVEGVPPTEEKPIEDPSATLEAKPVAPQIYHPLKPNILSFDIETVTPESIKNTLLQAGQVIQKDNLPGAIEFLIRDQKLNPLAFSRFAYLADLKIPETLLATLDESFSVYIFIDNGRPRAALLLSVKDETAFATEVTKNEKTLALAFEPMLLDTTTAPKNSLNFLSGTYLERPVRFANIDATLNLSIDYAIRGKQWVIGTSKDSLRAVLDKNSL